MFTYGLRSLYIHATIGSVIII